MFSIDFCLPISHAFCSKWTLNNNQINNTLLISKNTFLCEFISLFFSHKLDCINYSDLIPVDSSLWPSGIYLSIKCWYGSILYYFDIMYFVAFLYRSLRFPVSIWIIWIFPTNIKPDFRGLIVQLQALLIYYVILFLTNNKTEKWHKFKCEKNKKMWKLNLLVEPYQTKIRTASFGNIKQR